MGQGDHIDDAAIEALLSGNEAGDELASLAVFVGELRSLGSQSVPVPSEALASMFAEGFPVDGGGVPAAAAHGGGRGLPPAGPPRRRGRQRSIRTGVGGLSLAFKAAFSGMVAVVGLTAAGAAGALPGPAQHVVSTAVAAITPFEFPDEADDEADVGRRVSTDATDGGVDGRTVAEDASDGASSGGGEAGGGRPEAPGQAGLDRAGEGPAAGRAPASVPGPPGPAGAPPEAGPPSSPGAAAHDVVVDTPAAPQLPPTLPAGPPPSAPVTDAVTGSVKDVAGALPPLPTLPDTVPDTLPPVGGPHR